ncbi:MAG: response regulator transcription factor [Chloroflexota bacterium]
MMNTKKASVLVVDDDPRLLRFVQRNLELNGYRTVTAMDGLAALSTCETQDLDLLLVDLGIPGIDGFEVTRRVREFSIVPIIIITARDNEQDKVRGLDAGADDYLTKPFGEQELMARVRAVLRRAKLYAVDHGQPAFQSGDLTVDFAQQIALINDKPANLTPTEFRIISHLAKSAGRVVTQTDLLTKVWGAEYQDEAHLLRVNIARLRGKIEPDTSNPRYVITRPGVGYLLNRD